MAVAGRAERPATGIDRPNVQGPRLFRRRRSHWPRRRGASTERSTRPHGRSACDQADAARRRVRRRNRLGLSRAAGRNATPSQAVLEEWNRYHGGRAADALVANLVRRIRTWRPAVLLVPAGHDGDGLARRRPAVGRAAVKLAADPSYLADQFQAAGCGPWNVQRVYFVSEAKGEGTIDPCRR